MSDPVVIVGGGISGLTTAYRLEQAGVPYVLLEAGAQWGGNMVTIERDGYLYDVGPDAFLRTKTAAAELCKELGLGDELITPQAHGQTVFVAWEGRLFPMPEGLTLGVPKRPWPILETPLLSPLGKCRALLEPWIPARKGHEEESVEQFLTRRLGAEMAQRVAAPLLAGVYAGDARMLSMDAAFGHLVELERKHGSLFVGLNGGKHPLQVMFEPVQASVSPFLSLRRGLGSLIAALRARVPLERVQLGQRVMGIERRAGSGYVVRTSSLKLEASAVVVAGPPWSAAALLSSCLPEVGATLAQIRGYSTATVYFALNTAHMAHELTGSGFIVPPGEGQILAASFVSCKWAGRAPEGKALVRAFVGGARTDIDPLSNAELKQIAHLELTRFLGPLGPTEFSVVHRYQRGNPQPELGHARKLEVIFDGLKRTPGLYLIGSGYGAVGIPDCIVSADHAARDIIGSRG